MEYMEAFKNLIKNLALFFLIGAVPSVCWAGGFFSAVSWPSFFLLATGLFCALWLKTRNSLYTLKQLLLAREEEWALCEDDQIIECSSYFPGKTLQDFQAFVHAHSLPKVEECLAKLVKENFPFQTRLRSHETSGSYSLTGAPIEGKNVLFLKNITEDVDQERIQLETMQKNEELIKKLQTTLEVLPIFVWHRDKNQKITYCNIKYASAVQALPSKIYEEDIELIQPRAAKSLARKALNMQSPQYLDSAAIAEGDRVQLRLFEVPDICDTGTVGVAYDITDLQEAKAEIKHITEAHGAVLDHLTTAISIYDDEGILTYYNQAYVALHAFNEEFLQTKPRLDEVLEELRSRRQLPEYADFPSYKKRWMAQLREQTFPQEDLMHLPDERTLRIFSAPHPLGGLLFIFENITDSLDLERTNRILLDAYQTTLDHLFEGVIIIGSDNRLKIFNPSFTRLWKLTKQEIQTGQHVGDLLEKLKKLFDYKVEGWDLYKANIIAKVTDRLPKTGQLIRKDGVLIDFCYVPLPNGDHLISYTDATNASLAQQALKEKNNALHRIDDIQTLLRDNLSQALELRIVEINNFADILATKNVGDLNKQQEGYVSGILNSTGKLMSVLEDAMDSITLEAGKVTLYPCNTSVSSLLKRVVTSVSQKAEGNASLPLLKTKVSKDVTEWVVDAKQLKKALSIIVENTLNKMTSEKRSFILEARLQEEELEISIGLSKDGADQEKVSTTSTKKEPDFARMREALAEKLFALQGGRIQSFLDPKDGVLVRCYLPKISLANEPQQVASS